MRLGLKFLPCLPLMALCACASGGPSGGPAAPTPVARRATDDTSPYGLFLEGQAAAHQGQSDAASDYFGRAVAANAEGDGRFLSLHAFTAALLAGDVGRAADLAPTGPDADPPMRRFGVLVRGVEALAQGDGKRARALFAGPDADPAHEAATALLAPWAAAAAGDANASIAHPIIADAPVSQFFANLDQGKLFERAKRYDEAETAFRALIAQGDPGGIASLNLGEMLERRGRAKDAAAIYDSALGRLGDDGPLKRARARAAAGKPAPRMATIRQSAAHALMAPASQLVAQKQGEFALAYLRLALRLDPDRDEASVMVGDILSETHDAAAARTAYGTPRPGSEEYLTARDKLAWSYQKAGDKETALKIARETFAAAPADPGAAVTLADLLRAAEHYEESARVLDGVIAGAGDNPNWRLLYMRAVDFEASNRWPDAERDLQTALKAQPDEPELLNFLGYSWIDRGVKLPQALAMVQRAVSFQPDSGAMLDSLGWAYYRMGDFKQAVEKLESAVELEPSDPDVNNHLGDAYWHVDRKIEAQYQWRRVLTLEPSAKLKAEIDAKLKGGLTGPIKPAVVAGS